MAFIFYIPPNTQEKNKKKNKLSHSSIPDTSNLQEYLFKNAVGEE